jgi:2'-5' RNA ligase
LLSDKNNESQRLFIAVDVPTEVKEELARIQSYYKPRLAFRGAYSPVENAHITLSFLGNFPVSLIPELDKALRNIQFPPIIAKFGAINIFSNRNQISVLYLAIVCPEMEKLVQEINAQISPLCTIDDRYFVAHITLARISVVKDQLRFLKTIKLLVTKEIQFPINQFSLKKSEHVIDGSVYTDIAQYQLK